MNRAQAITPTGNGCFDWREDLPLRSVFAAEVKRLHHVLAHPLAPARQRMARTEVRAFATRAIELLREAQARMTFSEICARLEVQDTKARTLRRVMDRLCGDASVHSLGTYRKLYWVEGHENGS